MKANNQIFSLIKKLTPAQKKQLLKHLQNNQEPVNEYKEIRSNIIDNKPVCIYCKCKNVVKYGSYNGSKRYKCKECSKTFNEISGTSISWIKKKELWNDFLVLMLENKSLRQIGKELHIDPRTAFLWRHKVLFSLDEIFTKKFRGIVEVDDILIPFNQKGRRKNKIEQGVARRGVSNQKASVMVVVDRDYTIDMKLARKSRITAKSLEMSMPIKRLNKDKNVICSDEHPTIGKYFADKKFTHYKIKVKKQRVKRTKEGIFHVQRVNQIASEFKRWLNYNFVNVSTKYLQNYLNLFQMEHILNGKDEKELELLRFSLMDENTFVKNNLAENNYQKFLTI